MSLLPLLTFTFETPPRPSMPKTFTVHSLDGCTYADVSEAIFIDILSLNDIITSELIQDNIYIVKNTNKLNNCKVQLNDDNLGCAIVYTDNKMILLVDDNREVNIIKN
jgi:hypothetical protein